MGYTSGGQSLLKSDPVSILPLVPYLLVPLPTVCLELLAGGQALSYSYLASINQASNNYFASGYNPHTDKQSKERGSTSK
ncbi:hypothetical protein XENTR_v10002949 [Xenopus tropicalis]|nr:hypothetical protein XENTR_v10002949 [Xenopus tropicalis]